MTTTRPVAEGLFTIIDGEARLIASICADCSVTTFPPQKGCPRCTGQDMREELLPNSGTLWTWTTQEFLPKNPPYAGTETAEEFVSYGVGYVQLGEQCKVEGRITTADPEVLDFGMAMKTVVVPLRTEADGTEVQTFAFSPA